MTFISSLCFFAAIIIVAAINTVVSAAALVEEPPALLSSSHHHRTLIRSTSLLNATPADRGMHGWLGANQIFFHAFTPVINDVLVKEATAITIPNYHGSYHSIHFEISNIKVRSIACDNCVSMALANGYVALKISKLALNLEMDYSAHWSFFHSSGSCKPSASSLSASADVAFAPPSSKNPNNKPQIQLSHLNVDISSLSLDCSGAAGTIADAIESVVKNFFTSVVDNMLTRVIANKLNSILAGLNLEFPVDDNFAVVDFNVVADQSTITTRAIRIGVAAVVLPAANRNIVFPFPAPTDFKSTCASGGMVNVGLSTYTFNTATYTYWKYGKLQATFNGDLTAGDVSSLIPGFKKKLGKDAKLNASIGAASFPQFVTVPDKNALSMTMPIKMSLVGANGTHYAATADTTVGVSLNVTSGMNTTLFSRLTSLKLSNAQVTSSNVGGEFVLPLVMDALSAAISKYVLPSVNKILAKNGLPLPTMDGFKAYNSMIQFSENAICVATNIMPVK